MKKIAQELKNKVASMYNQYNDLDDELTSKNPDADAWSLKEILGHLVDSACNNHQRFVRLQQGPLLDFPGYHYSWIEIEHYNQMPFKELILLFRQYNILLAHLVETVDPKTLNNLWKIGEDEISLEFLIHDYLRHLNDHIEQFEKRLQEVR